MTIRIILLNGGSSAGKSTLARRLQELLPEPWLSLGVDDLIRAAPPSMEDTPDGLTIASDGGITVGPAYRQLEVAWAAGIAAIARSGVGVIVDEVLVDGETGQTRWNTALVKGRRALGRGPLRCGRGRPARDRAWRPDARHGAAAGSQRA